MDESLLDPSSQPAVPLSNATETLSQAMLNVLNEGVTLSLNPPRNAGLVSTPMHWNLDLNENCITVGLLKRFNLKSAAKAFPPYQLPQPGDLIELTVMPEYQASEEVFLQFRVFQSIRDFISDPEAVIVIGKDACKLLRDRWCDELRADGLALVKRRKGDLLCLPSAAMVTDWCLIVLKELQNARPVFAIHAYVQDPKIDFELCDRARRMEHINW